MKLSVARGRLYVTGPSAALASSLPGAAYNERRLAYEVSLTLETLGALRKASKLPYAAFKQFCTPEVIAWAERAAESRAKVAEAQNRIAAGWRPDLPWQDNRAWTLAPENAPVSQTELAQADWKEMEEHFPPLRVWKYRAPYDHQQIMAAVGILLDGSANLSQMGTGKTRAMCEVIAYHLREGNIDVAIVPVPKGVMGTWAREAPIWSDELRVHRLGFKPGKKSEQTVNERAQWLADYLRCLHESHRLCEIDPSIPNVILINYEVLAMLEPELLALGKRFKIGFFPDEGHRLANPQAKVTKTALKLAEVATRRVLMTGTPQKDKTGEGLWSQWYVVDLGDTFGANNVQFRSEWLDVNPWSYEVTPKPGALEAMGQRIAARSVRFLKRDALDLPDKVMTTQTVELTKEQLKAYNEMKEDLITQLGDDDDPDTMSAATASTQMAAIMRLAQITSGFVPTTSGALHHFAPNPKLNALKELIEENIDQQQIVVWAYFRADHDLLASHLMPFKPVIIRGGQTPFDHDRAETLFQGGERRLLVGQQQAAGQGRNFQAASLAIYYSQQYSIVDREQSEDRTHRAGSEIHNKITYVDLVAAGTVDEDVSAGLLEKRNIAEVVVDLKRKLRGW